MHLTNVLLDAEDGLVQVQDQLYFHWQQFRWDLDSHLNPTQGETASRFAQRLRQPLPIDTPTPTYLPGCSFSGIHPHLLSYYHFWRELVPQVLSHPEKRWLLPWWLPSNYVTWLCQHATHLTILPPRTFVCEELWLPATPSLEKLRQSLSSLRQTLLCSSVKVPKSEGRKIYISRKRSQRRHVQNEGDLLPILWKFGYEILELEGWSINRQLELFAQTTHLVAPHGAGLTNLLWMPPGGRVLEIRPSYQSGNFCFAELAGLVEVELEVVVPQRAPRFKMDPKILSERLREWHSTV